MKSFCLYCFVALMAGAILVSHGVTDETPGPFGDEVFDVDVASEAVVEVPVHRSEIDDLRAKYLEAAKQRAEMMDEEALRDAVETEEKSVAELRARQALMTVEQELGRIADEFTDTAAGQHAAILLRQLQQLDRNGRSQQRAFELPGDSVDDSFYDDRPTFRSESGSKSDQRSSDKPGNMFDDDFRGT